MSKRVTPGSGAVLLPKFNNEFGVSSFEILNGGSGYASTDPPLIEVKGTKPPLREGSFYPIISGVGTVQRIAIIDSGYGYLPETDFLGTRVGIATTSYVESSLIVKKGSDINPYLSVASTESSIIMGISGSNASAIFENGYNVAISTTIVGLSASVTPDFSSNQNAFYGFPNGNPSEYTSGVGTGARFSVFIVYDSSNGIPISTSVVLNNGGRGYNIGDTVSISGTFINGISPENDLSFVVSSVSNSQIVSAAGSYFPNISGTSVIGFGTGASFDILFDQSGFVQSIDINRGGIGYALTDVIGISATYFGGVSPEQDIKISPTILGTDKLPQVLYVDKIDDNNFQVSGLSTARNLDLISYGNGTQSLSVDNPNANIIISIDNIIQSPISYRGIEFELSDKVDREQEIIYVKNGINSITSLDTLQLNSEYLKVVNAGIGSTNAISVLRGSLGSKIGIHTVGTAVTVVRGDFNVVKDTLTFSTPPYGPTGPTGLEINSLFQGRVFSRRFDPDVASDKNIILDDISTAFTGIAASEFVLKTNKQDVVGLFTDTNSILNSSSDINNNPIILINNIPQISRVNFTIDTPGQNTLKFLSGVPNSGKIVRVGITTGFGYQPISGAGATVSLGVGVTATQYDSEFYQITQDTSPTGMFFKPDGTKLYVVGNQNDAVYEYNLSTPYDLSTVSYAASCKTGGETNPTGIHFKPDGKEFYYTGSSGDNIRRTILPTPWSLVGASNTSIVVPSTTISSIVGSTESTPQDLYISPDGKNVYLVGSGLDNVYQISLTEPWDFSTINIGLSTYYSVSVLELNPLGLTFTPDGKQMFIVGNNAAYLPFAGITTGEDRIYQYYLNESWNVSSAVFVLPQSYKITQDNTPSAITFNSNLTKMYVLGSQNRRVYQYTPSIPGSISSIRVLSGGSGYRTPPVIEFETLVGSGAIINAAIGAGGSITSFEIINAGYGYSSLALPDVVIGIPSSYSEMSVEYAPGYTGNGQGAEVSVVVGNGSSIINFKLEKPGVAYKVGDVLRVPGITTNPSVGAALSEFIITVEEVFTDKFSGFYPGQFVQFDDISSFFNGRKKKFTLTVTINNQTDILSLKSPFNSDLILENNLFVYINDILQEPGASYTYSGSRITFKEAPKPNSKCDILFFRGSDIDVEQIDPPRTIKEGDKIQIGENIFDISDREQFERIVKKIISTDTLDTFTYDSLGINTDITKQRPLKWTKQTSDRIINGVLYSKARPDLRSRVTPVAQIIKKVNPDDTEIYVDNVFPIFTDIDNLSEDIRDLMIVDNKQITQAIATAIVSTSSTISNIDIISNGSGYYQLNNPTISISSSLIKKKDPIFNWTNIVGLSSSPNAFNKIIKIKNNAVSVGENSSIGISTNGYQWDQYYLNYIETINTNSIAIDSSDRVIAVGQSGTIITTPSSNNIQLNSWQRLLLVKDETPFGSPEQVVVSSNYNGTFNDISTSNFNDSIVVVGDSSAIFTAIGFSSSFFFERPSPVFSTNLNSVTNNGTTYIIVGDSGNILTSNNARIWTKVPAIPTTYDLNSVLWDGSRFIAVGDNGVILTSTLGRINWERVETDTTINFKTIKYNLNFYVALDSNGELYFSFNLINWVKRSTNQENSLNDLIFVKEFSSEGKYIAVGSASTIIYAEPIYNRALAISSVSGDQISSIEIINPGFGYSQDSPPPIIIETDTTKSEKIYSFKAKGDFGIIKFVGVGVSTIDFVLESEQYDNVTLGIGYSSLNTFGVQNSQLEVGDYFVIYDSDSIIGHAVTGITTSLGGLSNYPESRVGTAASFLNGVYRVERVSNPVSGIVTVGCNFAYAPNNGSLQINNSLIENGIYGKYKWGKIFSYQNRAREEPKEFSVNTNNGLVGLSTAPFVYRTRSIL